MRKKRKKGGIPAGFWVLALCLVIIFSIAVRWSGLRHQFEGDVPQIQLEVLNGTGQSGVAMRMAVELRNAGIVSRLSRLTGCRTVVEQKQERPLVDATFVVGRDMSDLSISD